jgi:hypothetical protein
MQEEITHGTKPLIVRYQMFCDDRSGNIQDEKRLAELVCSMVSLKLYVEPVAPVHLYIYTLDRFKSRLTEVVGSIGVSAYTVVDIANPTDVAFADTIKHCTAVDRFCIRRMLSDFSLLPTDQFRLLLGTDVFFYRTPQALVEFIQSQQTAAVVYMVDDYSFDSQLYKLRYYAHPILQGLLGDFYCLAPGVELSRDAVTSCLNMIDAWQPKFRWDPQPPGMHEDFVHACEQQAAAILLARFQNTQLPSSHYRHIAKPGRTKPTLTEATVVHSHLPWTLIYNRAMPKRLAQETRQHWKSLGMMNAFRESSWPVGPYRRLVNALRTKIPQLRSRRAG